MDNNIETCPICTCRCKFIFDHQILARHNAKYFECTVCGFIFTPDPSWLNEAYINPINICDTGLVQRNIFYTKVLSRLLIPLFGGRGVYLDDGGGTGLLVRMMRDNGFNFLLSDIHDTNLFARGLTWEFGGVKANCATAIEVFEHLENPLEKVIQLFEFSHSIILSTELAPIPTPKPQEWSYYGFNHGQHISFFRRNSFLSLAKKTGSIYVPLGGHLHLLVKSKKLEVRARMCRLMLFFPFERLWRYFLPNLTQLDFRHFANTVDAELRN